MVSDIWLRTILIVRKEIRCCHIGYSYRLTAMVLLYAPSHRQDNTYHSLCYTSRGALAGTRNSSMGPPHEGSIRSDDPSHHERTLLPRSYISLLYIQRLQHTAEKDTRSKFSWSAQSTGETVELECRLISKENADPCQILTIF